MMFKILAYELAARDERAPCRQLFVTRSGALAESVQSYYHKLKQGSLDILLEDKGPTSVAGTTFTLKDLKASVQRDHGNNLPKRIEDLEDRHFPLFLTFEEV